MTGPAWGVFAGVVGFVTVAIVVLARLSAGLVTDGSADGEGGVAGPGTAGDPGGDADADDDPAGDEDAAANGLGADERVTGDVAGTTLADDHAGTANGDDTAGTTTGEELAVTATDDDHAVAAGEDPDGGPGDFPVAVGESMPPGALLANVALSQGLFGSLLVVGAWYARVPAAALGLGDGAATGQALALGVGLGVVLYAGNELSAAAASRAGVTYSEALRELLAPESTLGWVVLLGVALPVVAGFEELLFRGALVGAMAAGFGVSPWLLAVASSLVFGVAHGAQGTAGMVVTGALGFALAAAFVVTGSLAVVVVAHYLVNVLEFAVHEGLDVEWA